MIEEKDLVTIRRVLKESYSEWSKVIKEKDLITIRYILEGHLRVLKSQIETLWSMGKEDQVRFVETQSFEVLRALQSINSELGEE